jgi:hypothetical protein
VSGHFKRVEIDEMWTFVQMSGEHTKRIFQAKNTSFLRKKTTYKERRNRDFSTHLKRLAAKLSVFPN